MKLDHVQINQSKFYTLLSKRGLIESLSLLMGQESHEISLIQFFAEFNSRNTNLNFFFWIKSLLLKKNVIGYKVSRQNEKIIYLTEKGIEMMDILYQIESSIYNPN